MVEEQTTYSAGLIGCGRMGATIDDEVEGSPTAQHPYSHAAGHVAADRVDLVAAADIDEEQLEAAQDRYDIPNGYGDYREMIDEEDLDIVSVATRPAPHRDMVCYAAENGVPAIYCEKPLCRSMEEADAMKEAVQANDVHFNLGVNRRYMPMYRTIREMANDGEIGDRRAIIAQVGPGSALWGHSHAVDMIYFLNDDQDVDWVQGEAEFSEGDMEQERLTVDPTVRMGYIRFSDGVRGYLTQAGNYEFEVDGEDGKIRTLNKGLEAQIRRPEGESGLLGEERLDDIEHRSGTLGCIEELVAALDGEGPTSGSIEVAAKGQEIALGMLVSSRRGGERVELPLENREFYVDPGSW